MQWYGKHRAYPRRAISVATLALGLGCGNAAMAETAPAAAGTVETAATSTAPAVGAAASSVAVTDTTTEDRAGRSPGVSLEQVMGFRFFETKPYLKDIPQFYVGAGFTNSLLHAYADLPTRYGNGYVKIGTMLDGEGVAGQVGVRYPYYLKPNSADGYYLGGFIGHIAGDSFQNEKYNRLGAGAELSWVKANNRRITVASVALAFGEEKGEGPGNNKRRSIPTILFGYSVGLGL